MAVKAECAACGQDCTNANATHNGDVYHVGCLPEKSKRRGITNEEARRLEREWIEEERNGPAITSNTSITHYRSAHFTLNKESSK